MPVNIVACATVREADGLAMSSRNQHLDARQQGTGSGTLCRVENTAAQPIEARQVLVGQGFEVDYVEDIANRRLAAARLGKHEVDRQC